MLDSHDVHLQKTTISDSRLCSQSEWTLFLHQGQYPDDLIGKRTGEGVYTGLASSEFAADATNGILSTVPDEANLVVLSEHPAFSGSLELLQEHASQHDQIVIARLGYLSTSSSETFNSVAICLPADKGPLLVHQISLSAEDLARATSRGSSIHVIEAAGRRIGVLNCHDYTHATVIRKLFGEIDLLIVMTFNPATRLYEQMAMGDVHRLFAFVVISNVANYGGSGVYAPFRRIGPRGRAVRMKGALTASRGPCKQSTEVIIPIAELQRMKHINEANDELPPIEPPEDFFIDAPHYRSLGIEAVQQVIDGSETFEPPSQITIGLAHLKGLPVPAYLESRYHISKSGSGSQYIAELQLTLQQLSARLRSKELSLDFLVFPEVFMPISLEADLIAFSREFETTIISGFEYEEEMRVGLNRCRIIQQFAKNEHSKVSEYVKVTRSQYDARLPDSNSRPAGSFEMERGDKLLRFQTKGVNFAVLICYDISHIPLVSLANGNGEEEPPDLLFVVAYNPDAELYKHCAVADAYRFYQYVVMCNVAQFGGSGVFGPCRTPGERQAFLSTGQEAKGISTVTLDIASLRAARREPVADAGLFMKKPGLYAARNPLLE